MMTKMISLALAITLLTTMLVGCSGKTSVTGQPDIAGAYSEMNDPSFWIGLQKDPDKLLMTSEEIAAFTQKIASTEGTKCVDLAAFPDTLTRSELLEAIRRYEKSEEARYQGDKTITAEQYNSYYENRNEQAVQEQNPVQWGVVVDNCELRTFPTLDVIYDLVNDFEFDLCCETVLKAGECVAVLTASVDNNWFLVQAYNYLGWVEQRSLAVTDKASWLALLEMPQVLVVTGNRVILDHNNVTPATSRRELTMGTRLPLVVDKPAFIDGISTASSYVAQVPVRTADGRLAMTETRFPMNLDVSVGYLTYTARNITQQAFKLLGERYGWSGLWTSRDGASMITDIFQCFGIDLPRNASNQKAVEGMKTDLSQLTQEQRQKEICKQPVGTLMYMPGQIILYLGNYKGEPYVFQQVFSIVPADAMEPVHVATALVSDLAIKRGDGKTFAQSITDLIVLQSPS